MSDGLLREAIRKVRNATYVSDDMLLVCATAESTLRRPTPPAPAGDGDAELVRRIDALLRDPAGHFDPNCIVADVLVAVRARLAQPPAERSAAQQFVDESNREYFDALRRPTEPEPAAEEASEQGAGYKPFPPSLVFQSPCCAAWLEMKNGSWVRVLGNSSSGAGDPPRK